MSSELFPMTTDSPLQSPICFWCWSTLEFPFSQQIPLLGNHPKEIISGISKDVCKRIFISSLFKIMKKLEIYVSNCCNKMFMKLSKNMVIKEDIQCDPNCVFKSNYFIIYYKIIWLGMCWPRLRTMADLHNASPNIISICVKA